MIVKWGYFSASKYPSPYIGGQEAQMYADIAKFINKIGKDKFITMYPDFDDLRNIVIWYWADE